MSEITKNTIITNTNSTSQKRESGEYFVKVGYVKVLPETETQESQEVIVSLPYDIDVENMPSLPVTNSPGWVNKLNASRNKLRELIIDAGSKIDPGESIKLNLSVYLYRKKSSDKEEITKDNPFDFDSNLLA